MMDNLMDKLWVLRPYIQVFTDDWLYYTTVFIAPIVMLWVVISAAIDVYRWRYEDEQD